MRPRRAESERPAAPLQGRRRQVAKTDVVFSSLALARYDKESKAAVTMFRLDGLGSSPRSARHDGPSTAAHQNLLTLAGT